jgi:hypothetical protein
MFSANSKKWPNWFIAVLAFVGGLMASSLAPVFSESSDAPHVDVVSMDSQGWERMEDKIEALRGEFRENFQAIDSQLNSIMAVRTQVKDPSSGANRQEDAEKSRDWTSLEWPSVLPKEIGKELIVRGLSPFDHDEIAALTRKACTSLEELSVVRRDRVIRMNEQYSTNGQLYGEPFIQVQREIAADYKSGLSVIITEFTGSLDAFMKQK